jgi:hypothetical protein
MPALHPDPLTRRMKSAKVVRLFILACFPDWRGF